MLADLFSILLHDHSPHIHDRGPHYYEFETNALIHEPWNAGSSVFFLVPVFYWAWRLRGQYNQHQMIVMMLPFLFLNGVGSTLFHAFRASNFFLFLDFAPAAIMSLILTYHFWNRALGKAWVSAAVLIGSFGLRFLLFGFMRDLGLDRMAVVNFSYFLTGFMFLFPTLIIAWKTNWYRWHLIFLSIVFLSLALMFRNLDERPDQYLPMGTHWLWHIVSAFSVFTLGYYLYYLKGREFRPLLVKGQPTTT
jgi:hypothetical protein